MNDIAQWSGQVAPTQDQILLVRFLLDDSSSIKEGGNTGAVIEGYNGCLDTMMQAPGKVYVRTSFLNNTGAVESFASPKNAERLTPRTYRPSGNTPLFRRSAEVLQSVLRNTKRLTQEGKTARSMTIIFTDGGDSYNGGTAQDVKRIVDAMLATGDHIVGACAVNDGYTNFWEVFMSMGISERWIKVLDNNHEAVSQTMVDLGTMASSATINFSAADMEGFRSSLKQ